MNIKLIIGLTCLFSISSIAYSSEKELDDLIKVTNLNSLAQKAANENSSAALLDKDRSAKHWLPQIYLSGQSFLSNDPGTALFGKLSQREILSSDFMADSLNHPASSIYSKAALGINLPLYEGGQKIAMNKASAFMNEAKVSEEKAIQNEFYSEVVKNYLVSKNLSLEQFELIKINENISSIISKYQIGNQSNQLGYSGLLGLKSLKNKISALLIENSAKNTSTHNALKELSGTSGDLSFTGKSSLHSLINEYLSFSENQYVPSNKVQSFFENAKSANAVIGAEKSRNLPRIGLFGEGYAFNGDRALGKGFTTGIYLNWNLFSPNDYGSEMEATHKSKAAQYFAEASLQKEKMEYNGLKESLEATKNSLSLLDESEKYLEEQTKISHNLFKNGLINALQYVEVLSRRVDLIKSKRNAENELIHIQSQLTKNSNDVKNKGAL